ncbi:P-loop NTPase family protein [Allorhizobium taibaishanense]|uniref:AAA family ATPase n=1 Tax=Allorhizobium taibaishanense TaxID=887144 RepID=A0A1Q9A119_9HYPH|nr:AAA family ATPase [Allorhizobium taibaishanense]MBB4007943.1 adenylate kinase family enzyme [Allorhizobium taibaishanense]OLP48262.1 AAA family ATPase [Allorhizobium taibaishanense]
MVQYAEIPAAVDLLKRSNRVMVVGCSGGGKTTLSQKLARHLKLEYQSIDRDVRWLSGWTARDRDEQRAIIEGLIARDRWVMDGSGPGSFDLRLPRTDLVIWLRMPRRVCLWGVACRVWRNYGKVRVAMAEGCPEPLPDRAFLEYIWNFEKDSVPIFIRNFERYGPQVPVLVLKSRREVGKLLDLVGVAD